MLMKKIELPPKTEAKKAQNKTKQKKKKKQNKETKNHVHILFFEIYW